MWMGQGFLNLSDSSDDQCLEDVGYRYFVDLTNRSFFQDIEQDEFSVAESCKMHDLIHDLAIESAGEGYDNINSNFKKALNKNVRHVSFSCRDVNLARQMLTSFPQVRKIRTVLWLQTYVEHPISDAIILNFKRIRTLDLNCLGSTKVLDSIHRLKFVRYLDLSNAKSIKTLPNSITNMLNLHTLKLNDCFNLQELHRDIKKLVNLRHLEIDGCDELRYMPVGLGQLTNLLTLTMYVLPKSSGSASRQSGELKELMALNNLRGEFEIRNLRHGEDAATESRSANLKEKKHLWSLHLEWDDDGDVTDDNITGYEMSLQGLQPHPNLKKLSLCYFRGVGLSSWLQSLTNLVSLSLSHCKNCKHLDPLSQLRNVKELDLIDLPSLEYITSSHNNDDFLCSSSTLLTLLQKLNFSKLPNLVGWWGGYVVSEEENLHKLLPSFPRLSKLQVRDCPDLTCMPLYPHLEEELWLRNASLKPLQQTLALEMISFSPLSKLKYLRIHEIDDLVRLPDWFKNLNSLPRLEIIDCSELKDLCPGILHLTALKDFWIENCEELVNTIGNAIIWKALNGSLQRLRLFNFPNLESLPEGIQHLTNLQRLSILSFSGLKTIPEWVGKLVSLRDLEFWWCPELISLPEGIQSLTSLERLKIFACPILSKSCKSQGSADWLMISRFPHLDLSIDSDEDNNSGTGVAPKKWNLLKSCLP